MNDTHYTPTGEAKDKLIAFLVDVRNRGIDYLGDLAGEDYLTHGILNKFRETEQAMLDAVYAAGYEAGQADSVNGQSDTGDDTGDDTGNSTDDQADNGGD